VRMVAAVVEALLSSLQVEVQGWRCSSLRHRGSLGTPLVYQRTSRLQAAQAGEVAQGLPALCLTLGWGWRRGEGTQGELGVILGRVLALVQRGLLQLCCALGALGFRPAGAEPLGQKVKKGRREGGGVPLRGRGAQEEAGEEGQRARKDKKGVKRRMSMRRRGEGGKGRRRRRGGGGGGGGRRNHWGGSFPPGLREPGAASSVPEEGDSEPGGSRDEQQGGLLLGAHPECTSHLQCHLQSPCNRTLSAVLPRLLQPVHRRHAGWARACQCVQYRVDGPLYRRELGPFRGCRGLWVPART